MGGYQRYIVENERRKAEEAERAERRSKDREAAEKSVFFIGSVVVCAVIALTINFCC